MLCVLGKAIAWQKVMFAKRQGMIYTFCSAKVINGCAAPEHAVPWEPGAFSQCHTAESNDNALRTFMSDLIKDFMQAACLIGMRSVATASLTRTQASGV